MLRLDTQGVEIIGYRIVIMGSKELTIDNFHSKSKRWKAGINMFGLLTTQRLQVKYLYISVMLDVSAASVVLYIIRLIFMSPFLAAPKDTQLCIFHMRHYTKKFVAVPLFSAMLREDRIGYRLGVMDS